MRPARTSDIDTIADVFVESRAGLTFLPKLHTDAETRAWIRETLVPSHEVWVAELHGEVAGFAALAGDVLGHLYVRPDAQNRGLGSVLLERVRLERPHGFRFWVFRRNEGARRFYERRGCRVVRFTDGSENEEREPDALYEWLAPT